MQQREMQQREISLGSSIISLINIRRQLWGINSLNYLDQLSLNCFDNFIDDLYEKLESKETIFKLNGPLLEGSTIAREMTQVFFEIVRPSQFLDVMEIEYTTYTEAEGLFIFLVVFFSGKKKS